MAPLKKPAAAKSAAAKATAAAIGRVAYHSRTSRLPKALKDGTVTVSDRYGALTDPKATYDYGGEEAEAAAAAVAGDGDHAEAGGGDDFYAAAGAGHHGVYNAAAEVDEETQAEAVAALEGHVEAAAAGGNAA